MARGLQQPIRGTTKRPLPGRQSTAGMSEEAPPQAGASNMPRGSIMTPGQQGQDIQDRARNLYQGAIMRRMQTSQGQNSQGQGRAGQAIDASRSPDSPGNTLRNLLKSRNSRRVIRGMRQP